MSLTNAKQAAGIIDLVIDGFDLISKITDNKIDDAAAVVLHSIVQTVRRGETGKISVEAAKDGLADLRSRVAALNQAEDDRLRHNFDPETTGDG